MRYECHPCELISTTQAALSLTASVQQINKWIRLGRFPPPIEVDGKPLHSRPVIPRDEVAYVAALMTAGRSWAFIETEVRRLVNARARRLDWYVPEHIVASPSAGSSS